MISLKMSNADTLKHIKQCSGYGIMLEGHRQWLFKHIEELEAQLKTNGKVQWDAACKVYQGKIEELEATLERVRALPDKWRNRAIRQRNSATTSSAADQFDKGESKGTSDCADELEEAIKGDGDE